MVLVCTYGNAYSQVYNLIDNPSFSTGFTSAQPGGLEEDYPYRFKIFLPSIAIGFSQNGPSLYDLIKQDAAGGYFINFSQEENLEDTNPYRGATTVSTLGVSVNIKNWNFSIGHSARVIGSLNFPKDTYTLLKDGNAKFIGQEVSVGVALQGTSFNQYSLGVSYGTSAARVGVRTKFLTGSSDVSTEEFGVRLFTDDDIYQLRFSNNYIINSSSLFTFNDLEDFSFDIDNRLVNSLFTKNIGIGFDIGMSFKISDESMVAVSVYDIGKITWKNDVTNYKSKGGFSFDGLDIANYIGNESVVELRDSLLNLLEFDETQESYTSSLPLQFNISFLHHLNDKVDLDAAFNLANFNSFSFYNLRLGAFYKINKQARLGVSYSYNQQEIINLGLSGVFTLGPLQLFARTDNLLGVINPIKNGYTNGFIGLNLLFGAPDDIESQFE